MTISIFDFDHTLYQTPLPTRENRRLGRVSSMYQGRGWWGRKHSLDLDIFDIHSNPWVLDRYNNHTKKEHYNVLMTGRIRELEEQVISIINQDNLQFDEYHLADHRKTIRFKCDMIHELVDRLDPSVIYFYDDREEHIPQFRQLGDKLEEELGLVFKLFHIIDGIGHELEYGKYKINK